MCADRKLDCQFVAYGVRIGLRVDRTALLDALEQNPARLHLPFGFAGVRGEARPLVSAVLRRVGTPVRSAPPRPGAF